MEVTERKPIGTEQVRQWQREFERCRAGKRKLEQRIIDAEQAWKLRHWEQIRPRDGGAPEPASGWLVNVILSKHSDACDSYPRPVCLPREEGDGPEAEMLTDILPVILQQNRFDQVWSDVWWYKLKGGTGVYGVFWDPSRHDGLGDVAIRKIDLLNLFWEPGVADIQDSRWVFHAELADTGALERRWPHLAGRLPSGRGLLSRYRTEETSDAGDKTLVTDVYYKKRQDGRTVLHYAKYAGEELLFATENETEPVTAPFTDPATGTVGLREVRRPYAETGLYAHGRYPFVFDALFPEEGYPNCGFGYVDLCRDPQKYIDLMDSALLQNMLANVTPRWFVRSDGGLNEAEYADLTKPFVHLSGRLDNDSIRPIDTTGLSSVYVSLKQLKIEELKQVSGNRDVNNGGVGAGVTAASAIAALQEAGGGISRDMIAASYRAFRQVVELCIELIREFYDTPRQFRIRGAGAARFVTYDNAGLRPRSRGGLLGVDLGCRVPVFDIEVEVERDTPFATAVNNELAMQMFRLGAFRPENAAQTLLLLDMMDFRGKQQMREKLMGMAMEMNAENVRMNNG
ncbi:MAG: hypothetical protein IKH56_06165 [Oscillospiraceae bacterium]|nr:hypothetical protein [Oscillospiraceae bacterium]